MTPASSAVLGLRGPARQPPGSCRRGAAAAAGPSHPAGNSPAPRIPQLPSFLPFLWSCFLGFMLLCDPFALISGDSGSTQQPAASSVTY